MNALLRAGMAGVVLGWLSISPVGASPSAHTESEGLPHWVQIAATSVEQRTKLLELGFSIEGIRSDSVWGFASDEVIASAKSAGYRVLGKHSFETGRGGHHGPDALDFIPRDASLHNYGEMVQALQALEAAHPDLAKVSSIGKTVEGRDIWAIQLNSDSAALRAGKSGKPGAVFMGAHHAREHLSAEVPLLLAKHLLQNRNDSQVRTLLEQRDIWIIPMINPDGHEYDLAGGSYKLWRKNRRNNGNGTFGVDLNRNYSYRWGTGGASGRTSHETYRGPAPFSEPESSAVRDFLRARTNVKTLLSFHTYSELILYPWGHTNDAINVSRDRQAFEIMAQTMSKWNGYKPQQASGLYIASGDTTDWAYGELGIFAFTFELSPAAGFFLEDPRDKFYAGAPLLNQVFQANLRPCLYMIQVADNPHQVVRASPTGFLTNYVQPRSSAAVVTYPE
jgi:carboxypeptidase T